MMTVIRPPRLAASRARILLFSVVSIGVLMFGIAGMHASMADAEVHTGLEHGMTTSALGKDVMGTASTTPSTNLMQDDMGGMGGMAAMDCLMLGMMCVFGAIAVALLLALIARLQILLRRRLLVRCLAATTRLRPPEPPSLLVLSISRT